MNKLEDFFIRKYLTSQPASTNLQQEQNFMTAMNTSILTSESPSEFLTSLFTSLKKAGTPLTSPDAQPHPPAQDTDQNTPASHPSAQDTDLVDTATHHPSAQDTDLDTDTPPTDVHDADLDSVIPPPSSEHDSSIITTHEMQDEVTPPQDPPLIEEQPQPPVSEPPPPASPSSLPYQKTSDCERLYASMVTYKFSQNSYDNTVLEVLMAPNSSHKFCLVKLFDIDDTHILPLHPKLTAKPTKHKNALGIQWEVDMMNQERLSTKYKTSIWLKNKSQRDHLLKVLTDAMSACARISPELYRNVHKNICDDRLPLKSP